MRRNVFESQLSHLCFSDFSEHDDSFLIDSRWCLVSSFTNAIKDLRESYFYPSDHLCVDDRTSRWYGVRRY